MHKSALLFALTALAVTLFTGCASHGVNGPERKLGRGINNLMELPRGGEIRRSLEQTALFSGRDVGKTSGFLHGFNRSLARTGAGVYEILTFPIPNGPAGDYGPIFLPENPVYPDNYKPGMFADQIYATDGNLGFSGGEVAPFIPGSRFRVFDNP